MILHRFTFEGFVDPQANYYRLPNDWFQICHALRQVYGSRIIAPLKLLEFVLKHTWGYRHFDGQVCLSADEVCSGRRFKGKRLDSGTGLSANSVRKAGDALDQLGLIELHQDQKDQARRLRTYRPRLRDADPMDTLTESAAAFSGFALPTANYFRVPWGWTDLQREMDSAVTILVTEYFFRHGWGYNNPNGIWLDAEQVANGRRYQTGRRYDAGIGYDLSSVYRAMEEAVGLKLLVWTEVEEAAITRRLYNLRLKDMPVGEDGRFLERLPWESAEEERPPLVGDSETQAIRNLEEVSRNVEGVSGNLEDAPIGKVEAVICNLEGGSRNVEEVTGNLENTPIGEVEAVVCNVEGVSRNLERVSGDVAEVAGKVEARSATLNTLTDTLNQHEKPTLAATSPAPLDKIAPTPDTPLCAVVAAGQFNSFLGQLGITNPARGQILQANVSPDVLAAWVLYTWSEAGLDRNKAGYLVKRLLSPADRESPPAEFITFAQLTGQEWITLLGFSTAGKWRRPNELPDNLQAIAPIWLQTYATAGWQKLPPGVRGWLEELAKVLGVEQPPNLVQPLLPGRAYSAQPGSGRSWNDAIDA